MKFNGNWILPKKLSSRYETILERSLSEDDEFSKFKSIEDYWQIVGCDGGGKNAAEILSKIIKEEYPQLLDHIEDFQKNDEIGKPPLFDTQIGRFSPNTLFYMVVLGELNKYFGSLENKKIIEVGSAYGGQCFIISQQYNFKSYTLIDIPNAIGLSKKYLSNFLIDNVIYQDTENIKSESCDLFISNFAVCEVNEDGWDFYIDNIISKSNNFYIMSFMRNSDSLYSKLERFFNIETYSVLPYKKTVRKVSSLWIGRRK